MIIIGYIIIINLIKLIQMTISIVIAPEYLRNAKYSNISKYNNSVNMIPLSILVPTYNDKSVILDTIKSILSLNYKNFEIIVINDGSSDGTLNTIIESFNLKKISYPICSKLHTEYVYAVYHNPDYPKIYLIDKKNAGKADALNAGINLSRYPYFVSIDAGSQLDSDALIHIATAFMGYKYNIAVGGIARVGWSIFNVGAFEKKFVLKVGGYTAGIREDLDLVIKLHKYMRKQKYKYKISLLSNPVCREPVPQNIKSLYCQLRRRYIGLINSLWRNRNMFLPSRCGAFGILVMLYYFLFEILKPAAELLGLIVIPLSYYFGLLPVEYLILFFIATTFFGIFNIVLWLTEIFRDKRHKHLRTKMIFILACGFCGIVTAYSADKKPNVWELHPVLITCITAFIIASLIIITVLIIFTKKLRQKNAALHTAEELVEGDNKLREVKERLERTIQTAPVMYALYVDGIAEELNEKQRYFTGLDVGGAAWKIYADPSEREDLLTRIITEEKITNEVRKFKFVDGEVHRCLINAVTVEYERKYGIAVWSVDIEKSERQKDELKNAHRDLQNILDSLPIPARIVDLENRNIVYVNDSFLDMFEYDSPRDVYGRRQTDIMCKNQSDGVDIEKKANIVANSIEAISIEADYVSATGRTIKSLLVARQLDYNGKRSSVGILRDISQEQREAELRVAAMEAEEASHAKTTFLANMSHEIRTPLNAILGFAELASDSSTTAAARDIYLKNIKESSEVLLNIINDILDISKIEANKIILEHIPFNMCDIFKACQMLIAPKAEEKGITLYYYAEPSVGKMLLGDPTRLRQALLNLLTNAVKFTNIGMVKLLAAIENTEVNSVTIRFEVKDSGIGMTEEQIARIFEPFMQADASTTRKYGGTGLGLPITKNIIELMGGELMVQSTPGIGSKFSFILTFETIDSPSDISRMESKIHYIEKPIFKGDILVCEDNVMNQQVICEHLARTGLETVIAGNGKEGVEYVRQRIKKGEKPFDLIFMDIHMPVMDGLEAADELIKIGNKSPIIALTANVMTEEKEKYKKHDMFDYLPKPFQAQTLWTCLLKYLTPVDIKPVNESSISETDKKHRIRLNINFVRDNQSTYKNIADAVEMGDIKLAHRLAHTLKSVAGLIGKNALQEAAYVIEYSLKDGKNNVTAEQMNNLDKEINTVLSDLTPLLELNKLELNKYSPADLLDKDQEIELLNLLEALLAANNTDCLDYVDKLRAVQGMGIETETLIEKLIEQIESFDYKQARETLSSIKEMRCEI